jgi:hypothetical protein
MMREILGVADEASARRRWFHDDYFDLFVWQGEGGDIVQFQLCYGIDSSERALVWHKQSGFFLDGVEAGKSPGGRTSGTKQARGGALDIEPVAQRFEAAANALPEDIRPALTALIQQFSEQKSATPARRKRFRRASWQRV